MRKGFQQHSQPHMSSFFRALSWENVSGKYSMPLADPSMSQLLEQM